MSIRPINIMMSIINSQHIKTSDIDHNLKHSIQEEQQNIQNIKNKESIPKIPDNENNTEIMDTIKQGMGDSNNNFNSNHSSHQHENSKDEIIDKALLENDKGNNLDIIG